MNKKVLITAGPTFEPIDPVRFIGNRSSGKQGIGVAKAFAEAGYDVFLVVGPINENLLENLPKNIHIFKVNTAQEMCDESLKHINCDVAVHTAAVSDFRPEKVYESKIKKDSGMTLNDIKFVENVDILATFCNHINRPKVVIGFAAETNDLIENAKKKLLKKNCDFVIANDVSNGKGFGKDKNKVFIVSKNGVIETDEMDKYLIGKKIVEIIENLNI